jgi:ribosomal-protein-alanine N-acetyltransferase
MIREGDAYAGLLASLHQASFPPAERWDRVAFAALLDMPGCFACIHDADASPCGMALLRVAADEAELLTIAVLPQARGQGVGGALVRTALAECVRRGASRVYLEVAPGNAAACALYRRGGFVEIGRRHRYYLDGSDALVMEWPSGGG